MDSDQLIASINRIYDRFNLIQSLRLHMLRVAGVGDAIVENWHSQSISINGRDIVAALLIHDLGNIVKFNFDEPRFWYGKNAEEIDYWKGMKRDTVAKYGTSSDYSVTLSMAKELGVSERLLFLISNMGFGKVEATIKSDDYDLKICTYADQRVGPSGVVTIKERFEDLRKRYGRGDGWRDEVALALEGQIFGNTRISPLSITEESVQKYMGKYAKRQRL